MQAGLRSVSRPMVWLFILSLFVSFLFVGCGGNEQEDYFSVLVFSKTAGFRHASIEDGQAMFQRLADEHKFNVEFSEDASLFNPQDLERFNVIVFLNTTGDVLDQNQERGLEGFMAAGGGWMGIHAACDTEYDWPWYNQLVGAYFDGHPNNPNVREADITITNGDHPATAHLEGDVWHRNDEWYNFRNMTDFEELLKLDESSYEGGTNGDNHSISWCKEFEQGRMFYTGLGHTPESYTEEQFVQHIWGGLQYVVGPKKKLDFSTINFSPEDNRFNVEALVTGLYEPMEMELLPDGRPIWIQRRGEIMVYEPDVNSSFAVNKFDVWTTHEDGMLGLALDPDFEDNQWMYIYYSPNIETSINRLSRFKWTGDDVDEDSEQIILEVPVDRNECCHSGGSLEFGPGGLLHLSVGDNTNPFDSEGFAPIDDSKELGNWDARRSASNTNDLRGKILRIKVEEDGSYTTPTDNLFPDGKDGRPEIYVMGCRNPFRISVDQRTGTVYWGDVGPDAGRDSTEFGPRGHCEVNFAPTAGYYGWPLFVADNKAYRSRDFTVDKGGGYFDPMKPINNSRFNTGATELPPARPAMVFYPYANSPEFPIVGEGGRNPMAGPVYYQDDYGDAEHKFPEYYDGKFFFYEWMRDWMMAAELDEEGKVTSFERFLPNQELRHPMDMLFAKDGSLYILEYGPLWFKENKDARILRIRYNGGNRAPVPAMEIAHQIGAAPLDLVASIGDSEDYDGDQLTATWFLDGNEIGKGSELNYQVEQEGVMELTMELQDSEGNTAKESKEIIVGNSIPQISMNVKGNSSFFFAGMPLEYDIKVSDVEDGTLNAGIDPKAVTVSLDYVEGEDLIEIEYGHQTATEETQFLLGKNLIAESDCESCHKVNETNIGPSYMDVAKRYRTDPEAVAYLSEKIIKGGGGVWGEQAMAAHPQLSENEAEQMANYILSLAGPAPDAAPSLPLAGSQALAEHREGLPGRYYFQASYTDQGGTGDLPRLTTRERVVLRSPVIAAHNFSEGDKVMAYNIPADDNPLSDEEMDVLVGSNNGWASYGLLDLTGITSVEAVVILAPNITAGGTIEVLSGNPKTGTVIGSATIKQGISTYGENQLDIPLDQDALPDTTTPIYFRFKADGGEVLGAILAFTFKRGTSMSR